MYCAFGIISQKALPNPGWANSVWKGPGNKNWSLCGHTIWSSSEYFWFSLFWRVCVFPPSLFLFPAQAFQNTKPFVAQRSSKTGLGLDLVLGSWFGESCSRPRSQRCLMFSSRSFVLFHFTFRYGIHSKLFSLSHVRYGSRFHLWCPVDSTPFVEKTTLPPLPRWLLLHFSKPLTRLYLCGSISRLYSTLLLNAFKRLFLVVPLALAEILVIPPETIMTGNRGPLSLLILSTGWYSITCGYFLNIHHHKG